MNPEGWSLRLNPQVEDEQVFAAARESPAVSAVCLRSRLRGAQGLESDAAGSTPETGRYHGNRCCIHAQASQAGEETHISDSNT